VSSIEIVRIKIFATDAGLVDTRNAALYLGRSPETLSDWRKKGRGPKYMRGGIVMYRLVDLDAFIAESLIDPRKVA